LRTPPHRLLVSAGPDDALHALGCDARRAFGALPGVVGPTAAAAAFATAWSALTGTGAAVSMRFRVHAIEHVANDLAPAPGSLRVATEADGPLALAWFDAFAKEALPHQPNEADERVDRFLQSGLLFFWCDPEPVAILGITGRTTHGARVGPVYTPPAFRGRGYGTAAVAALTRGVLVERSYCCLYTDLANPTSNRIYRRIGYRPVCDVDEVTFTATIA
jgi:predicted GNAT family acetyltransferase